MLHELVRSQASRNLLPGIVLGGTVWVGAANPLTVGMLQSPTTSIHHQFLPAVRTGWCRAETEEGMPLEAASGETVLPAPMAA